MKLKLLFICLITIVLQSCQNPSNKAEKEEKNTHNDSLSEAIPVVLVYNFYGTHRCPTCIAIEEVTKNSLNTYYKEHLQKGIIKHYGLNIDDEANFKICEKLGVYGSSVFLIKKHMSKEQIVDLTDDAFKYALQNPDKFKNLLILKIDELIKTK